jgi:hypothetical protein
MLVGTVVLLALLIPAIDFLVDEPLRRQMENRLNRILVGYTVRIGRLDFHLLGFSLDLEESTIFQNANPKPPVAYIPKLTASVQWRELMTAHVVGDFRLTRPKVYINLKQFKTETEDKVPMKHRGWQDVLEAIYPLKINEFVVDDGDFTYVDQGPFRPLHLSHVNFIAGNIRNIRSKDRVYPSTVHLETVVFDSGKAVVDGNADFLAEPHLGVKVNLKLEGVDLDYFKPITNRANVWVQRGVLSATGFTEYAPRTKVMNLDNVTIERVLIDYVHTAQTAEAEKETVKKAEQVAEEVKNEPGLLLRIDRLKILNSEFGYVDKVANPPYRMFLTHADAEIKNLSNHVTEGVAEWVVTGKFTGSGETVIRGAFRPAQKSSDFDLLVSIDETEVRSLNNLLRAKANFDVAKGTFSFYSELAARNGTITGYVKPLFKDLDVYDRNQDRNKPFLRQAYEGIVGSLGWVLENKKRGAVATRISVSGKVSSPQTSTFEMVINLLQNAFIKAILPGFEERSVPNERPKPLQSPS